MHFWAIVCRFCWLEQVFFVHKHNRNNRRERRQSSHNNFHWMYCYSHSERFIKYFEKISDYLHTLKISNYSTYVLLGIIDLHISLWTLHLKLEVKEGNFVDKFHSCMQNQTIYYDKFMWIFLNGVFSCKERNIFDRGAKCSLFIRTKTRCYEFEHILKNHTRQKHSTIIYLMEEYNWLIHVKIE